jgi:hypothetical protein
MPAIKKTTVEDDRDLLAENGVRKGGLEKGTTKKEPSTYPCKYAISRKCAMKTEVKGMACSSCKEADRY